jgi:alpha-L-rhamnosidase
MIGLSIAAACAGAAAPTDDYHPFLAAKAMWPGGRSTEKNLQVGFRAVVTPSGSGPVTLRLTASTLYRASVNGKHVGYGPARGPHGWFRVDEWDISKALKPGPNVVSVEVAGYNVNSYYTIDQPSFLQAEVVQDGKALMATGQGSPTGFDACILSERVQKVQRYSFQRPFSEVYRIAGGHDRWKSDPKAAFDSVACVVEEDSRRYLPRVSPYPDFLLRKQPVVVGTGTVSPDPNVRNVWKDRSLTGISDRLKGYLEKELEIVPSVDMQKWKSSPDSSAEKGTKFELAAHRYSVLDFGLNDTGFICATVRCQEPTTLVLAFDEVLRDNDVDFKRLGCVNLIHYELPAGTWRLESFEPYTFRYLKAIALKGKCSLSELAIREYGCSEVNRAQFRASDPALEKLFAAGVQTFRQNVVDVFTDCPSRERAGWLCDSFFTARVAPDLCGNVAVETAMMQNFRLPEKFEFLPPGMLPMCYPADHNDGVYIANWALWFVVQLEEYLARSGDKATVDALKPRVMALFEWFSKLKNLDGLIEKAPGWVFIEWSDANNYVQDVNYPSNMLYAGALAAAGRLYGDRELTAQADAIRSTIRRQAYDGTWFVDNAIRKSDGKLSVSRNHTEVCQYYAFYFGVASPKTYPALWQTLRDKFGPKRATSHLFPDVAQANSFIGNMLRIELLSREGLSQQILDESRDYLLYMADRTGTLWENVGDYASCNHGFASHVVHTLYRDVLGAREIDRVNKRLKLRFAPVSLDWCEGMIPTPDGPITLKWRMSSSGITYACRAPKGYKVEVENATGLAMTQK